MIALVAALILSLVGNVALFAMVVKQDRTLKTATEQLRRDQAAMRQVNAGLSNIITQRLRAPRRNDIIDVPSTEIEP